MCVCVYNLMFIKYYDLDWISSRCENNVFVKIVCRTCSDQFDFFDLHVDGWKPRGCEWNIRLRLFLEESKNMQRISCEEWYDADLNFSPVCPLESVYKPARLALPLWAVLLIPFKWNPAKRKTRETFRKKVGMIIYLKSLLFPFIFCIGFMFAIEQNFEQTLLGVESTHIISKTNVHYRCSWVFALKYKKFAMWKAWKGRHVLRQTLYCEGTHIHTSHKCFPAHRNEPLHHVLQFTS